MVKKPPAGADDDARLFRDAMRDVKPLPDADRKRFVPAAQARVAAPPAPKGPDRFGGNDDSSDTTSAGESIDVNVANIPAAEMKRLRRGAIPIEAGLDLHGLVREEAHRALATFIERARASGKRCVLVIHGKGMRSERGTAVLKASTRTWMTQGPLAESVLALTSARPQHGGTGAIYVLLRRR
ncbi:MAG: Smr/MutS family protein [Myxococcaceae bacterium]